MPTYVRVGGVWNGSSGGGTGPTGAPGPPGPTGPTAGSAYQVLYKNSSGNATTSSNLDFNGDYLAVGGTISSGGYPVLNNYSVTYGVYNGTTNYVYPPSGKTISQLIGFIPSIHAIYFAGGVDGNDSLYCYYSIETGNNRIAVTCYNSEQRSTPYFNWMAIWSA